jgi:pantoate kinase
MRAYAPGSVTGLFAPATGKTDRSRGASVAIEDGVVVDLEPAEETEITVEGEPAPFEPVERVLSSLEVSARIDVLPEVPLGCGFGASGAATLATALAANAEFDLGVDREDLVDASHRAERAAGTGQGDVYIQDRGGLLWSASGEANRREVVEEIEYASAGGMSTKGMLADESFVRTASEVGHEHLDRLPDPPTVRAFAELSRAYLAAVGIATPFVERELERVERAGGAGSMALFGETVFAVGVRDVLSSRCAVANGGARSLE